MLSERFSERKFTRLSKKLSVEAADLAAEVRCFCMALRYLSGRLMEYLGEKRGRLIAISDRISFCGQVF